MKRVDLRNAFGLMIILLLPVVAFIHNAEAAVYEIGLSPPPGGALNLGAAPTHYTVDHAPFLAAPNESAMPPSPASGNEVGIGITFDDASKMLTFEFAYGSAFGFVDLVGDFTDIHLHAPGPVMHPAANTSAAPIHSLFGFHTASTTKSGKVMGSVLLSAGEEMALFDNAIYVNIHSTAFPAGEIRAQLIPVTPGFVPVEVSSFSID